MLKSMNYIIVTILAAAILSGCIWKRQPDAVTGATYQDNPALRKIGVKKVTHEYLKMKIDTKASCIILDARVPRLFDNKVIPGAIWLDYQAPKKKIIELLPDKSSYIVTYCGNKKYPLSERLAKRLVSLGYKNVYEYPEGIDGWRKAGYKTETYKKAINQ
jgi:rhodanese-related sulfurtransferase